MGMWVCWLWGLHLLEGICLPHPIRTCCRVIPCGPSVLGRCSHMLVLGRYLASRRLQDPKGQPVWQQHCWATHEFRTGLTSAVELLAKRTHSVSEVHFAPGVCSQLGRPYFFESIQLPYKRRDINIFFFIYKRENGAWRDQGICPRSWGLSSGSLNPEPVLQATDLKLMVLVIEQSDCGHF